MGNSPIFIQAAKKVIIELNQKVPIEFVGINGIYLLKDRPSRQPIPITAPSTRIGTTYMPCNINKIAGIVLTNEYDSPSLIQPTDSDTQLMASYILDFLQHEVRHGHLPSQLPPLQSDMPNTLQR